MVIPRRKPDHVFPDQVWNPKSNSQTRLLADQDLDQFEQALTKPPKNTAEFMKYLEKRSPLRLRRVRKDLAWIEKMARKQGVSSVWIPDWLKS